MEKTITKKEALAKYLNIDVDEIKQQEFNENIYSINERREKEGNNPQYYIDTIKEFKKILTKTDIYKIDMFLSDKDNIKETRNILYREIEQKISKKPVIKDWLYNSNILYHLLNTDKNDWQEINNTLVKLWFGKDIIDNRKYRTINNGEYLIITDEEADDSARDYILDSVWAFNTWFIIDHIKKVNDYGELEKSIKAIQQQCEGANSAILAMIEDEADFVADAISADGRGHFISSYDGEENEQDGYFIYRTN